MPPHGITFFFFHCHEMQPRGNSHHHHLRKQRLGDACDGRHIISIMHVSQHHRRKNMTSRLVKPMTPTIPKMTSCMAVEIWHELHSFWSFGTGTDDLLEPSSTFSFPFHYRKPHINCSSPDCLWTHLLFSCI
jgi:hypothetical protein